MSELAPRPEFEARKEQFMGELASFIYEAGINGWAAEAAKVKESQRPGFKEIAYERGEWGYRDSYAGYYMAPGSSVVYFRDRPVWYMTYGGPGQTPIHYREAKETYAFLRRALSQPEPKFPVRGPIRYQENDGQRYYRFSYEGDLFVGTWVEQIDLDFDPVFEQRGDVGLIIDKDENRNPIYPWDL